MTNKTEKLLKMQFCIRGRFITILLIFNILFFFSFCSYGEEPSCDFVPIQDCKGAPEWLLEAQTSEALISISEGHVTWHKGAWHSGVWKGGRWFNGLWEAGAWEAGLWSDGDWYSGTQIKCFSLDFVGIYTHIGFRIREGLYVFF